MARRSVIGHRPISDLGVHQIVGAHASADTTTLAVNDDLQQPVTDRLRALLTWTPRNTPRASGAPLFDMFPHARGVALLGATDQYRSEIIIAVHSPVNGEVGCIDATRSADQP